MEPPPFGDGNFQISHIDDEGPYLQWSHRLLAMVTRATWTNTATIPGLQWSHRLLAMVTI